MSISGGNIGLTRAWPPGFNGWAGANDLNLLMLDALAQPVVKSVTISTPPGSPAQGDAYIVGGSPTGAWAGKANQIAIWDGTAWQFAVAKNGWRVYNQADNGKYEYDGTNWVIAYLEGTWTPSAGGTATYTAVAGKYVRIGRIVNILCDVTINVLGTGSTTVLTGLPFNATPSGPSPLYVTFFSGIASSVVLLNAFISTIAPTSINLAGLTAAAASLGSPAILGNGARVIVGGSYFAA